MNFNLESVSLRLMNLDKTWENEKDELAILLSSSRSEGNIKDKFNLLFSKNLDNDESYLIIREWKRVDLAIIKDMGNKTVPKALFEFKLRHSSFIAEYDIARESGYLKTFLGDSKVDKITGERYRKNGVHQDIEKLKNYRNISSCYVVLGGLHPLRPISDKYNVFNKDNTEIKSINSSFKKFHSAEKINELCNENIQRYCTSINAEYRSFKYSIGNALGIEWMLLLWIIDVNSIME